MKQVKMLEFLDSYWKIKAKSNHLKLADAHIYYILPWICFNKKYRNLIKSKQDPQNTTIMHL